MTTPWWLKPASELNAMPQPDPEPPLTMVQGMDLIRRLNAPGGASRTLTASEHEFVCAQPAIRDGAVVQRMVTAAQAAAESDFVTGIQATLAYAQGRERRGPLSGRVPQTVLPLCGDLDIEADLAEETLAGAADIPLPYPRDLLTGVEHTCLWLTCRTEDPPLDLLPH